MTHDSNTLRTVVAVRAAALLVLCAIASPAGAQTTGRIAIGASVTRVRPADADLGGATSVGFLVRQVPREGWRASGALNWFNSDVEGSFANIDGRVGELRVRPLMGGVSYTIVNGRLATSMSVVGGPAFNRLRLDSALAGRLDLDEPDSDGTARTTTLAVRPGANVSWAITPRVAVVGFAGYLFNRPTFTVRTSAGAIRKPWRADALVLSIGSVVSVF